MNLVDRKGIFELKWEGFNLVREVNIELHVPRLDKVVDPVFEVSSWIVLVALRNRSEQLLKSDFVDELFRILQLCHIQPFHTWEVALRINNSRQLCRNKAKLANVLIVSMDLYRWTICFQVIHLCKRWLEKSSVTSQLSIVVIWGIHKAGSVTLPVICGQLHSSVKETLLLLQEEFLVSERDQNSSFPREGSAIEINVKVFWEVGLKCALS